MIDRVPNLMIAGVPKAGTSSLYTWINDHPQAQGSNEKETCFFADPDSHTYRSDFNAAQGLAAYKSAFPAPLPDTKILFEATPTYIYSRTALDMVPDLPSAPKCLFILRDPASQILSVYQYYRDNWNDIPADMSFDDFLMAVRAGNNRFAGNELASQALTFADYRPWLAAWQKRLGRDRMKICTFDQLQSDPRLLMENIAGWAGLDPSFYTDYAFPIENETYTPKNRLLQNLNIAMRGALPKGRFYGAARKLYRKFNTRAPIKDDNAIALHALRTAFSEANRDLARDFGLDLTGWKP